MPSNVTEKTVATPESLAGARAGSLRELPPSIRPLLQQRGVVPNVSKTLAHAPALALGVAGFLKSTLGDGALHGWYTELIVTRMSDLNVSRSRSRVRDVSTPLDGLRLAIAPAPKSDP